MFLFKKKNFLITTADKLNYFNLKQFRVCNNFIIISKCCSLFIIFYYSYFVISLFRFSLAFLDVGDASDKTFPSFVKGSSFNDGFNVHLGVFGTDNLKIQNNVFHHSVGSSIQVSGRNHQLVHNLVALSLAEATYKVGLSAIINVYFLKRF